MNRMRIKGEDGNEKIYDLLDTLEIEYDKERFISISRVEGESYYIRIMNDKDSDRLQVLDMWLTEKSMLSLVNTILFHLHLNNKNYTEMLKDVMGTASRPADYSKYDYNGEDKTIRQ